MTETPPPAAGPERRTVLLGAAAAAGVGILAACSNGGGGEQDAPDRTQGAGLVALEDVPVGGAVPATTADGAPIVVVRPDADRVVAFSAVCTHMGCTVRPDGAELFCPCHGSVFEAATGRNVEGPAPRPLDGVDVRVEDGQVVEG